MKVSVSEAKAQLTDLVACLIDGLGFEIVAVTAASAARVAAAMADGAKAFTLRRSTSATASPLTRPRSASARCSMSETTSRGPISGLRDNDPPDSRLGREGRTRIDPDRQGVAGEDRP